MDNRELKHYGVIGMKWGMRKYQNPDGTLTAAGKKRYGENGKYEYKSHGTKRNEKKYLKAFQKGVEAVATGKDPSKYQAKVKKYAERLMANKIADKNYQEYAKKTSTGKAILQNILFGTTGARGYQQARANGEGRAFAAAMGIVSNSIWGNIGARIANAKLAKAYSEGKTKKDIVEDTRKKYNL